MVKSTRTSRNGCIELKCFSENIPKLQKFINGKLSNRYETSMKKLLKPKIKSPNVKLEDFLKKKEIEETIKTQNNFINGKDFDIAFIKYYKDKKVVCTIFDGINGKLYKKSSVGKICQFIIIPNDISQCRNCQRFRHNSKNSNNSLICPKYSGSHNLESCRRDNMKCNNCIYVMDMYINVFVTPKIENYELQSTEDTKKKCNEFENIF